MIYLIENNKSGHHKLYFDELLKIDKTQLVLVSKTFSPKKKIIRYFLDRISFMQSAFKQVKNKAGRHQIIHFLDLDNLYLAGIFAGIKKNYKVLGTLHHLPQSRLKMHLFKIFARKLDRIIVHSEYIQRQLIELGLKNVDVIDYPVFHNDRVRDKIEILHELKVTGSRIVLSALGGTRIDKGLDLLLHAFQYLTDQEKKEIFLNINGKEEYFKKDYIRQKMEQYRIDGRIKTDYLTNQEFQENIIASDLVVIPYRSFFTGNSGPMIEAVYRDIPVLGPDSGNIGYLIKKYQLGYTFSIENARALSEAIRQFIQSNWKATSMSRQYKRQLNVNLFREKYQALYEKIISQ